MDIFLVILGFCLVGLGLIGSFLPVLPGPFTGWLGLFVLHLTKAIELTWSFLGITLGIAILIWILDYIIPAMGTKKFGGTRSGVIGTTIGLIIGLISPIPFGFIIGAFVGALIGELIHDSKDTSRAVKAAFGSFIGFIFSSTIKFMVSLVFLVLFCQRVYDNWSAIIS